MQFIRNIENKSPTTITSYLRGVRLYLGWCEHYGHPVELTRAQVQQYAAELIADNKEANTVRLRQASLPAFARWLVTEGELSADPLEGLKPPKLPEKVVEALTDDQLRALLKACQGRGLRDRRDEAIVRLVAETAMAAGRRLGVRSDGCGWVVDAGHHRPLHRGVSERTRRRRSPDVRSSQLVGQVSYRRKQMARFLSRAGITGQRVTKSQFT